MDDRTLRYIAAIARYQNLTKAAEALYVGQPTLSKCLASVEERLGLKLFRRVGHRYVPTYAGERFIERSGEILRMTDGLENEMSDILNRSVGELNVAFAHMRSAYMLPLVLPEFQRQFPNVKVNLYEGSSDENDRRLLDGEVEVAFYTRPSVIDPRLEYETLTKEELLICTCQNHPLSQYAREIPGRDHPGLDLALLKDELVLMMLPQQRTRQIVDGILRENQLRLDRVLVTSNIQAIMGLVAAGFGVSFVFDSHLKHRVDPQPIDCYSFGHPRTVHDFVAATRKGAYLSRYGRAFIDIVRECV